MGKYSRTRDEMINNGRLSGLKVKDAPRPNVLSRLGPTKGGARFNSRIDARMKLVQLNKKANKLGPIRDAREILQRKERRDEVLNSNVSRPIRTNNGLVTRKKTLGAARARSFSADRQQQQQRRPTNVINGQEPLVIVTGLGNVRKEGNKLKIIDHDIVTPQPSIHLNTNLIHQNGHDFIRPSILSNQVDNLNNNKKYEPIKIKINNDLYAQHQSTASAAVIYHNSSVNPPFYVPQRSYRGEDSMDFETTPKPSYSLYSNPSIGSSNFSFNSSLSPAITTSHYNESNVSKSNGHHTDYSRNGYKLLVSNLHPRVTEDDILELFSDIGPIKRAKLIDKGLAEVVYVRLEDAREAIDTYDQKELDGRPMVIGFEDKSLSKSNKPIGSLYSTSMMNSSSLVDPIRTPQQLHSSISFENVDLNSQSQAKNTLSNRFKLLNKNKEPSILLPEAKRHEIGKLDVDSSIVQQVLFKKSAQSSNPVTFTVKL